MKQVFFILLILLVGLSCGKQVAKTKVETKKESVVDQPKSTTKPTKPKSKLEQKRARINQVMIGQSIPDGIITAMDGSQKSTTDFRGKLLVIDFWATWCGPCLQGAPKFKEIGNRYRSDKVEFISVSIDNKQSTWKGFLEQNNWSGEHYWMGMNKENPLFSFLYKEVDDEGRPMVIIGVPKYVIISPEGMILDHEAEFPTNPKFEEHIKRLIP